MADTFIVQQVQGPPGASGVTPSGTGIVHVLNGGLVSPAAPANLASNGAGGDVTGILAIANGGTGLSVVGTNNQVLTSNGTSMVWSSTINAALTMTGDVTGPSSANIVSLISASTGNWSWAGATASPTISQPSTVSATGQNITLAPQPSSNANATPGSFIVNVGLPAGSGAEAGLKFQRNGVLYFQASADSAGTTFGALYLGQGIVPSGSSNAAVICDGTTATFLNAPPGGQATLTVAGASIIECLGSSINLFVGTFAWASTAGPVTISQSSTAGAAASNMTLSPQASTATNGVSGILNINVPFNTGTHAGDTASGAIRHQLGGITYSYLGSYNGSASSYYAMWFGSGVVPTLNNFVFLGDNTSQKSVFFNTVTGGTIGFSLQGVGQTGLDLTFGNSQINMYLPTLDFASVVSAPTILQATTATASATGQTLLVQAQSASGTTSNGGVLSLSGGNGTANGGNVNLTSGAGSSLATCGTVNVQANGNTVAFFGTNGFGLTAESLTINATSTTTLTNAQYIIPIQNINTVSLTGNATIILPNAPSGTMWWFQCGAVTFNAHNLTFQCGSGAGGTVTITALGASPQGNIIVIVSTGANGCSSLY